jgi:hypothetical protein
VATLIFLTLYCRLRSKRGELIANGIIHTLMLITIAMFSVDKYNWPLMKDN